MVVVGVGGWWQVVVVVGGPRRPQMPVPAHRFGPVSGIWSSTNNVRTPKATPVWGKIQNELPSIENNPKIERYNSCERLQTIIGKDNKYCKPTIKNVGN